MNQAATPGTSAPASRIEQLDVTRGFAVLGIYWINIAIFALPHGAYALPSLWGEATQANILTWAFSELFVEGSMRGLFSMLFGASAMVFLDEARLQKQSVDLVDRYYRRSLYLILFGLIHAYILLWPYDVLYAYGLFGLFLFPLRRLRPALLLVVGVLLLAAGEYSLSHPLKPWFEEKAQYDKSQVVQLPQAQAEAAGNTDSLRDVLLMQMEEDVEVHRSGYWIIFFAQRDDVVQEQSTFIYLIHVFDIGGMMLIGMALLRWGVFSGRHSRRMYLVLALGGYVIGVGSRALGVYNELANGFSIEPVFQPTVSVDYDLGRLPVTLGHVGLLGLVCTSGWLPRVTRMLARVGRMALTNYIMQTVISILLFYGFGFALFGALERFELVYVCIALWAVQIAFSQLWLRFYLQGPLEWLWRSLIYAKRQPLRRK